MPPNQVHVTIVGQSTTRRWFRLVLSVRLCGHSLDMSSAWSSRADRPYGLECPRKIITNPVTRHGEYNSEEWASNHPHLTPPPINTVGERPVVKVSPWTTWSRMKLDNHGQYIFIAGRDGGNIIINLILFWRRDPGTKSSSSSDWLNDVCYFIKLARENKQNSQSNLHKSWYYERWKWGKDSEGISLPIGINLIQGRSMHWYL